MVDAMVAEANGGTAPVDDGSDDEPDAEASAWGERITAGRFDGKTVIVTGAGSGIGRATASRIAREGGRVIAVDVSKERLDELAATTPDVVTVVADITKDADIAAIVKAAGDRIDGLGNIAGIMDDMTPLHEMTDAVWERVMAVNVTGMVKLTRAVIPAMLAGGGGSIVNVASEAALRGSAAGLAYTASKHAVVGITKSSAFMYAPRNIRVNAVAPGPVMTNIQAASGSSTAPAASATSWATCRRSPTRLSSPHPSRSCSATTAPTCRARSCPRTAPGRCSRAQRPGVMSRCIAAP